MKKHLFLSGPPGCGKSTLLREALGSRAAMAGGFVTCRVNGPDGKAVGHMLLPSAASAGVEGFTPLPFLDCTQSPPVRDNEVFRVHAVRLLEEAVWYPFTLLDQIGGFELVIPQFRQALADFLSSDRPCIGAVMALSAEETLRCGLGLGEKYTAYARRLHEALSSDADTVVQDMGADPAAVRRIVAQWVREYT